MKKTAIICIILVMCLTNLVSFAQDINEPWSDNQLMQPEELALTLGQENKTPLYVFNIGPAGLIKNGIEIGESRDAQNLLKFEKEISTLPKDANIVVYCGCCPFSDCPNIRPVFNMLNEKKFANHKLLNLQKNLKVDWIDKGFPMSH